MDPKGTQLNDKLLMRNLFKIAVKTISKSRKVSGNVCFKSRSMYIIHSTDMLHTKLWGSTSFISIFQCTMRFYNKYFGHCMTLSGQVDNTSISSSVQEIA